jgi:Condensation domain
MSSSCRPAEVITPFRGTRAATGPLTFGQRNVLLWIDDEGNKWSSVIPLFQPVPDGRTAAEVAAAVAVLIGRHEALRTCYLTGNADPVQKIVLAGDLIAEVCEVDGDDGPFVAALEARLSERPFELATELPVRAAIVTKDSRPALLVLIICHMAVDVGSVAVLRRELTALLAGASPWSLGATAIQPLEAALAELSALAQRRSAAALRHWETRLSLAPLRLAVPAQPGVTAAIPRRVRMTSPAGALALDRLAACSAAGRSATVLAAAAAVLGLRTGTDTCLFASVSGNRFYPGFGDYVGPLAQDALVSFSLAAGTFRELADRAWAGQLAAYRHSRFDAAALWAMIDAVQHRRGHYFGRDWVFNDVGIDLNYGAEGGAAADVPVLADSADSAEAALDRTRLEWTHVDHVPVMLFFRLLDVRGVLDLELHVDARYFPPHDVELLLRGVERLLVAAARADVPLAELTDVIGCPPLERGDGWVRTGQSWVDLAEVRRLLSDATGGAPCAVEARPGGHIIGYTVGERGTDPRKMHLDCVALLPARPAAATPAWYVVCDGPPADPSDLDAWRSRPVLIGGDGR